MPLVGVLQTCRVAFSISNIEPADMLNGVQISEEKEEPVSKDMSLSLGRLHL